MCPGPSETKELFPDTIKVGTEVFTREKKDLKLSGLNPKAFYQDAAGNRYILKIEKERTAEGIFKQSVKKQNLSAFFQTLKKDERDKAIHVLEARKEVTFMSVLASKIAKELCPGIIIPDNVLCSLEDGTPAVLSKFLPEKLNEFLSEKEVIKAKESEVAEDKRAMGPTDWDKPLQVRELNLTEDEAYTLGKIYYAGLLMGHWDLFNNINLSNSGSIVENGKVKPSIVDWGNCLGVGFGGVSQDATAFNNPQFSGLGLPTDDSITGFKGAVPFDTTVYPVLPRQLVEGLFNLDKKANNPLKKKMLEGFVAQHEETLAQRSKIPEIVVAARDSTLVGNRNYVPALSSDLLFRGVGKYEKNAEDQLVRVETVGKPELIDILDGRVDSLDEMVRDLKNGKSLQEISEERFNEIETSQSLKR